MKRPESRFGSNAIVIILFGLAWALFLFSGVAAIGGGGPSAGLVATLSLFVAGSLSVSMYVEWCLKRVDERLIDIQLILGGGVPNKGAGAISPASLIAQIERNAAEGKISLEQAKETIADVRDGKYAHVFAVGKEYAGAKTLSGSR